MQNTFVLLRYSILQTHESVLVAFSFNVYFHLRFDCCAATQGFQWDASLQEGDWEGGVTK